MRFYFVFALLFSLLFSTPVAFADDTNDSKNPKYKDPDLNVGDPAPVFNVSKWLRGEEVKHFQKDKIYVVEFWATWCGPCIQSIPHLNELQKKYQDKSVVFIGISSEPDVDEVQEFLKIDEPKIEYRVGYDEFKDLKSGEAAKSGKMNEQWLNAAGENTIPTAFVVNREGRIAWIGHPDELGGPLAKIVDGKWDMRSRRDDFLADLHHHQVSQDLWVNKLSKAIEDKKTDDVLQIIDEMVKIDPKLSGIAPMIKFQSLLKLKEYEQVYAMGDDLLAQYKDDEMILNGIAEKLIGWVEPEKRNPDLALRFAYRAHKVAKKENPGNLFVLAEIYCAKNDFDRAVELQAQAVEKLDPKNDKLRTFYKEVLQKYIDKKAVADAK